jgi:hypothetical protein
MQLFIVGMCNLLIIAAQIWIQTIFNNVPQHTGCSVLFQKIQNAGNKAF